MNHTNRIRAIYNPRTAFGNIEILQLLEQERSFPWTGDKACGICFAKGYVSTECPFCSGTGMEDGVAREPEEEACPDCKGTGSSECYACNQETECEKCDGSGIIKK